MKFLAGEGARARRRARTPLAADVATAHRSAASRVATLLAGPLPILLGSTSTLTLIGVLAAVALPLSWFALPETLGVTLANVGTTTRDAED